MCLLLNCRGGFIECWEKEHQLALLRGTVLPGSLGEIASMPLLQFLRSLREQQIEASGAQTACTKAVAACTKGSTRFLNILEKSIHVHHNIWSYLPPSLLSLSPIISSAHPLPIFMSFPKQNKTLKLVSVAHMGLGLGQSVGARESYQCLHPQNRMSSHLQ